MHLRLLRHLPAKNYFPDGCVLTIGNFDGCHRGHEYILSQLIQYAKSKALPSVVLTFSPLPAIFFGKPTTLLSSLGERLRLIARLRPDFILCLPFSRVVNLSPEAFVRSILVDSLSVRHLFVGDDFRFGHRRTGDYASLLHFSERYEFSVAALSAYGTQGVKRISSTMIRTALQQGHCAEAARLLGRYFTVRGRVIQGEQAGGSLLDMRTANLAVQPFLPLAIGVYVVRIMDEQGHCFEGVANYGYRPSLHPTKKPLLEVHIFDFFAMIYGTCLTVSFLHKLRDEMLFEDVAALRQAMHKDAVDAKAFLMKQPENAFLENVENAF